MPDVLSNIEETIFKIQFNRPGKKNALSLAMYNTATEAIKQAEENDNIHVIFFCGSEECFTSGNDLKDFLQSPPTAESSPVLQFLHTISQANKPIVAAVNGPAIGIGTTMLLHCDLVYAGSSALFQMPFVNLGVCPEAASSVILPRLLGHAKAAELLMLGESFGAQEAHQMGIVNAVYKDSEFMEKAWQKTKKLAAQPFAALKVTKSLLKQNTKKEITEAIKKEGIEFIQLLQSPEAQQIMKSFFAKK